MRPEIRLHTVFNATMQSLCDDTVLEVVEMLALANVADVVAFAKTCSRMRRLTRPTLDAVEMRVFLCYEEFL